MHLGVNLFAQISKFVLKEIPLLFSRSVSGILLSVSAKGEDNAMV